MIGPDRDDGRAPYPPWIQGSEEKRRWPLCEAIAREMYGEENAAVVWLARGLSFGVTFRLLMFPAR